MTRFWVSIFGLIFGIGVATGIVLEFEFGTNWATYSRYVGDIFGSALAAEGIFAFFLESGFLAILVFGWNKVSPKMHFFSTLMVAIGATFSAVWIVVANSWQQTPAGYHIVGSGLTARAEITDFWAMVFNPSSMDRLSHVLGGTLYTGAFLLLSISAYYLIKNREIDIAKAGLKLGLVIALLACGLQAITGHASAIGVAKNQPAKMAAYEAHYQKNAPMDFYLFGWVDEAKQTVQGLKLPGLTSWLIKGDTKAPIKSLADFKPQDRPPVNMSFQFYHIMLYAAVALGGLTLTGLILWLTGHLEKAKWYLMLLIPSVALPHIANQAGWFAAEVGRQPWIVYNLLTSTKHMMI
jgi:cytochrome d ubiquinol oxidase subunit I